MKDINLRNELTFLKFKTMNNGIYLDEELLNSHQKLIFVLVYAGYPEKHMEAPSYRFGYSFS